MRTFADSAERPILVNLCCVVTTAFAIVGYNHGSQRSRRIPTSHHEGRRYCYRPGEDRSVGGGRSDWVDHGGGQATRYVVPAGPGGFSKPRMLVLSGPPRNPSKLEHQRGGVL